MTTSLMKSEKICSLEELSDILVADNDEQMVPLSEVGVNFTLFDASLPLSTGQDIYVREGVAARLQQVQDALPKGYALDVTSGYRRPAVQEEAFRNVLSAQAEGEIRRSRYTAMDVLRTEWIARAHRKMAAPEVAGHPSGGAVDVRLRDRFNRVVDMGTQMHDIAAPLSAYTQAHHYDFTPPFQKDRNILRDAMCAAGFAPANGQWWHFSYGDREWAAHTGAQTAVYGQCEFNHETGEVRGYNAPSAAEILDDIMGVKQARILRI